MCVCVWKGDMYKCVNEYVEVRGQLSASFVPQGCPPCFLGQDLSLGPDENRLAGLQALVICAYPDILKAGVTTVHHHSWSFLHESQGTNSGLAGLTELSSHFLCKIS